MYTKWRRPTCISWTLFYIARGEQNAKTVAMYGFLSSASIKKLLVNYQIFTRF